MLDSDQVHTLLASGTVVLENDKIEKDLSTALGWDVRVLHKERTNEKMKRLAYDVSYRITVYALDNSEVVSRSQLDR